MKCYARSFYFEIMFLCLSVTTVLANTSTAQSLVPVDMTVSRGEQVTFTCSGSHVSWFLAPTKKIFTSPDIWNTPKGNKYDITGNYNLVIKDADPSSDAGTYKCDTDEDRQNIIEANLVVLGNVLL